jgi:hypothetical protein
VPALGAVLLAGLAALGPSFSSRQLPMPPLGVGVARRWFGGVLRVPAQLGLQIGDLRSQLLDQLFQSAGLSCQHGVFRPKLSVFCLERSYPVATAAGHRRQGLQHRARGVVDDRAPRDQT